MPSFQLFGLPARNFAHLSELDADELAAQGVRRVTADSMPGYPCRVSLADAEVGEDLFLLTFEHHAVESPYRSSGPIYVRAGARECALAPGEVPACVRDRQMSLRAYDSQNLMVAAKLCDGGQVSVELEHLFEQARISYVHLHNAKPGCYSCTARRVGSRPSEV